MSQKRVILVVYPGFEFTDLAGLNVFSAVNDVHESQAYTLVLASSQGGLVTSHGGISVACQHLDEISISNLDTVLISGAHRSALRKAMSDTLVLGALQASAQRAERYGSICAGAFLLGAAGLLNGKRCVTHWAATAELARYVPAALVDSDALYVCDDRLWTSAGATAGVDMALSIVEQDYGALVMGRVAKWLVLYSRRPGHQSQFSTLLHAQATHNGEFGELIDWLSSRVDQPTRVSEMAKRLAMTERTFYRRFTKVMGTSPSKFFEDLRMESAKALLEAGQSVKCVAASVGFASHAAFRKAFRIRYGTTPSHFATMFCSQHP